MISCGKENMGCQGGYLTKTWDFLHETGIVTDDCYPYTSGSGENGKCYSECTGSGSWVPYKSTFWKGFPSVDKLKQELYTNGPVQTGFTVYQDFMSYKSGVYIHSETSSKK